MSSEYIGLYLHLSSHFKRTEKPHHLSFLFVLASFILQVSELSSELDTKQQDVVSLQKSLAAAQQEKDNLEQALASLVRVYDALLAYMLTTCKNTVCHWLHLDNFTQL